MFKTFIFAAAVAGTMSFGHMLMRDTQSLIAGEQALANINPYATPAAQDAKISGALAQINQAR
jgi:uncharacterized membrane protein